MTKDGTAKTETKSRILFQSDMESEKQFTHCSQTNGKEVDSVRAQQTLSSEGRRGQKESLACVQGINFFVPAEAGTDLHDENKSQEGRVLL